MPLEQIDREKIDHLQLKSLLKNLHLRTICIRRSLRKILLYIVCLIKRFQPAPLENLTYDGHLNPGGQQWAKPTPRPKDEGKSSKLRSGKQFKDSSVQRPIL